MTSEQVEFQNGDVRLSGTLSVPDSSKGCVLLIHGSGPLDRDANTKAAKLNIFNTFASELFEAGFASFRYDKRGIGASGGDYYKASQSDLVADGQAALDLLQSRGVGPIFICGHSEGTALSPMIAEGNEVAGQILLCPYAATGREIMMAQAERADRDLANLTGFSGIVVRGLSAVFGRPMTMQKRLFKKVESSDRATFWMMGGKVNAAWLREFMNADPKVVHARSNLPTLVVVANRDVQCPPSDGRVISQFYKGSDLVELDDLSHLLRHTTVSEMADYQRQIGEDIDTRVASTMNNWLANRV